MHWFSQLVAAAFFAVCFADRKRKSYALSSSVKTCDELPCGMWGVRFSWCACTEWQKCALDFTDPYKRSYCQRVDGKSGVPEQVQCSKNSDQKCDLCIRYELHTAQAILKTTQKCALNFEAKTQCGSLNGCQTRKLKNQKFLTACCCQHKNDCMDSKPKLMTCVPSAGGLNGPLSPPCVGIACTRYSLPGSAIFEFGCVQHGETETKCPYGEAGKRCEDLRNNLRPCCCTNSRRCTTSDLTNYLCRTVGQEFCRDGLLPGIID